MFSIFDEESYRLLFVRISSFYWPRIFKPVILLSSYCVCAGKREEWLVNPVKLASNDPQHLAIIFEILDFIKTSSLDFLLAVCTVMRMKRTNFQWL